MATDEEQLNLQLRQDYDAPGLLEVQSTVIKAGPQAWKTAALLTFGDKATGEVKRRTLRVQTWRREGSGYGFENKSNYRWSCDDEEVTQLLALLSTHLPSPGSYTLMTRRLRQRYSPDSSQGTLPTRPMLSFSCLNCLLCGML